MSISRRLASSILFLMIAPQAVAQIGPPATSSSWAGCIAKLVEESVFNTPYHDVRVAGRVWWRKAVREYLPTPKFQTLYTFYAVDSEQRDYSGWAYARVEWNGERYLCELDRDNIHTPTTFHIEQLEEPFEKWELSYFNREDPEVVSYMYESAGRPWYKFW